MGLERNHPQPVEVSHKAGRYPEKGSIELSLVVPIHNERAGLDEFFARLLPVLRNLGCASEIVCVDDGSDDGSQAIRLDRASQIGPSPSSAPAATTISTAATAFASPKERDSTRKPWWACAPGRSLSEPTVHSCR